MDFLFEIGLEELPARYVNQAENDLKKIIIDGLKSERIVFSEVVSFSTPRRLAVIIKDLSEKQEDLNRKSVGPSVEIAYRDGVLTKAGEGFIKSQDALEEDIKIVENEKGRYISVEKYLKGGETREILPEILKAAVKKMEFEKSMKWGSSSFRFARPVKWFVTMFGNEVLPFEFEGLKGGNRTRGMRYFASQEVELSNPEEYEVKLKENFVIPKREERKKAILESIKTNCENDGDIALVNDYLLEEVVNLIEYPYAMKGEYSESYLLLPEDITTITMETHQRYFPVKDSKGKLSNKFIVIRNAPEYSETVKKGNEKVIEPRLADAKFFFDEDLKNSFSGNVEKLKEVVFQKDMGTIYDKMRRSQKIAEYLIEELNLNESGETVLRTVELAKADLVSNVIGEKEFTKLQGFMGSVYAEKQGERKEVAKGILEHYLPRFQGDMMPETVEGAIAGIADRIDTVVGCFSVGLKPTGSKDPYALRRAVQGIILVALNSGLDFGYKRLIGKAYEIFKEDRPVKEKDVVQNVTEFFTQRLVHVLSERYGKDIISYEIELEDSVTGLRDRLEVLKKLSETEEFGKLVNLLRRVKNILKEERDLRVFVDPELFVKEEEKELYALGMELENLQSGNFKEYIDILLDNPDVINNYFDNVTINDENVKLKNNRLSLLKKIENSTAKIMDI